MAKKSKKKVSGLAFNALGIAFIMAILPLMVAFVSSASGIASDGEPSTSILPDSAKPTHPSGEPHFSWVNNGENVSSWYFTNHPSTTSALAAYNCLYIKEGICQAEGANLYPNTPSTSGYFQNPYAAGNLAGFRSFQAPQTHGDTTVQTYAPGPMAYRGGSGDGHFTFKTWGAYYDLDSSKGLDELTILLLDNNVQYSSSNSIFENITFNTKLTLEYAGESITIDNGNIRLENKLCFDVLASNWGLTCGVGFKITYDLNSFQAHQLQTINNGDYDNTSMTFDFYNFEKDSGAHIGSTALPFGGIDSFAFGLEARFVDVQSLNFFVKGGSLIIGVVCLGVALASTPYYDPVKNALRGSN